MKKGTQQQGQEAQSGKEETRRDQQTEQSRDESARAEKGAGMEPEEDRDIGRAGS